MNLADHIKADEILRRVKADATGRVSPRLLPAEAIEQRVGGVVAFVFDDGYRSNYVNALPIFRKYGYAATLAVEVDKIGQNYNADPDYPVCTAADLREMIRAGWEVCNHPDLDLEATEAEMVTAAKAENRLLVDLLTGAKIKDYSTGAVTDGSSEFADEFGSYTVTSAVYRGGSRTATSDMAYRYLFDKVRTINGSAAERGDHLYAFGAGAEQTMMMSAWSLDTTLNSVGKTIAFLESIAQTRSKAILYGHDTPVVGGATPRILASELEVILYHCRRLGLAVVPLERFSRGNAISDGTFENSLGSLAANSGDTTAFSTDDTLNGGTRCVVVTATSNRANMSTAYQSEHFVCEPFCRYRIRVRYKIDEALTLNGGAGNRNHGLNVSLETRQANTSGATASVAQSGYIELNDPAGARRAPYQATSGYEEYSVDLVTGMGASAFVSVGLFQCTGTVRIGQVIAEKLDSIIDRPLSGTHTFNTTSVRGLYFTTPNSSGNRQWGWTVDIRYSPPASTATYDYAYNDSADIASPESGQTCYVLGAGATDFAGQGGKLATYNGSSWSFSTIAVGTIFKANTAEGLFNRWFRHRGVKSDGAPEYEVFYSSTAPDRAIVLWPQTGKCEVAESSGLRSDAFTWIARPYMVG